MHEIKKLDNEKFITGGPNGQNLKVWSSKEQTLGENIFSASHSSQILSILALNHDEFLTVGLDKRIVKWSIS